MKAHTTPRLMRLCAGLGLMFAATSAGAVGWGTDRFKMDVGDYALQLTPAQFDLVPQRSQRKIGLRLSAQVLNLELSRQEPVRQNWTRTTGLRGRVEGQVSSYQPDALNTQLEGFRRWEGSTRQWLGFAPDIATRYELSTGLRRDHLTHQDYWVFNANQTLKAPLPDTLQWHGLGGKRPLYWLVDFKQSASHRLGAGDGARDWAEYSLLLALEKDIPLHFIGRSTHLAVMLGPELSGNKDQWIKAQARLRVRLKF